MTINNKILKIRCFVSDPQTGIGFFDDFSLESFNNDVSDFFDWYLDVLDLTGFCLDHWVVV